MQKINHLVRKYASDPMTKVYTFFNNIFAFENLTDYEENRPNLKSCFGLNFLYRPLLVIPNLQGRRIIPGNGVHGGYTLFDDKYHHHVDVNDGKLALSDQFMELPNTPVENVRYDVLLRYMYLTGDSNLVKIHMRPAGEFNLDDAVKVLFDMFNPLIDNSTTKPGKTF